MDFGALYIHPVEYAYICHGRRSVISSCRTALVYKRRSLAIIIIRSRSHGRDKQLGIAVTDILQLPGEC